MRKKKLFIPIKEECCYIYIDIRAIAKVLRI